MAHTAANAGNRSPSATERLNAEIRDVGTEQFVSSGYKPGIIRHIVLFRYKDEVRDSQRNEVTQRFVALQRSLRNGREYIVSIETGTQTSGEQADHGLQQAFVVTFRSEGDRNFYVGRPFVQDAQFIDLQHDQFKDYVTPFLDGVVVFDYSV
ncbi:stress responsive alpha-beta barrel [Pandoraea anapnoica]|uniref:Stress responsive alpha-beta barrel n=1 Tax=Pandoraea anapnoica TaxID=2508301 RepID=A0A5E5ASC9_9BURK|nr:MULTISPECIES: Dabb family protein [Pandoraea]VVE59166.1 stress responsive alpha-beta barrel [Pandoraea iniqua]VVE75917.1 stress responsive alpha-beta barrel [Pandoraea anapnoica]